MLYTRDYMPGTRTCMADGKTEEIELKGQNVMYYELEGGTTFIIRPSGTEPKVKVYIMAKGADKAEAAAKVDVLAAAAKEIVSKRRRKVKKNTKSGPVQGKIPFAPGRGICCANSCPLPRAGRGG